MTGDICAVRRPSVKGGGRDGGSRQSDSFCNLEMQQAAASVYDCTNNLGGLALSMTPIKF